METTNHSATAPVQAGSASCHGGNRDSPGWLSGRRGLALGGGAAAAAVALALSRNWLMVAQLAPLLFLLPCTLMMLMCMKGMNHGQQPSGAATSTDPEKPIGTGAPLG